MNKFIKEKGLVLPLDRANVDTDFIIPKQFLNPSSVPASGLTFSMSTATWIRGYPMRITVTGR